MDKGSILEYGLWKIVMGVILAIIVILGVIGFWYSMIGSI